MSVNLPYTIPDFVDIGPAKTTYCSKDINLIACLPYLFLDLGRIRCKRAARDAAEVLWTFWKSAREGRAFLQTATKITFTLELQKFGHSESKECRGKFWILRHELRRLQCYYMPYLNISTVLYKQNETKNRNKCTVHSPTNALLLI